MKPEVQGFPEGSASHSAWIRLEDQIGWYDQKSRWNQKFYKRLTIVQLLLAIVIPPFALIEVPLSNYVAATAGGLIALLEGIQHLYQFSTLWMEYRSTAEHLKHEKHLFLSAAGPYRESEEDERLRILAERVEEHVSTEHAHWVQTSRRAVAKTMKRD